MFSDLFIIMYLFGIVRDRLTKVVYYCKMKKQDKNKTFSQKIRKKVCSAYVFSLPGILLRLYCV